MQSCIERVLNINSCLHHKQRAWIAAAILSNCQASAHQVAECALGVRAVNDACGWSSGHFKGSFSIDFVCEIVLRQSEDHSYPQL